MSWPIVAIICLFVLAPAWVWNAIARQRRLRYITTRPDQEPAWRHEFPDASPDSIRTFLRVFVDGFALSPRLTAKFTPQDRVMDVYRAIYPPRWIGGDSLEIECFAIMFKKRYAVDLHPAWRDDVTLGVIFGLTQVGEPSPQAG